MIQTKTFIKKQLINLIQNQGTKKILKQSMYVTILLVNILFASALTIQELMESTTFNYNSGEINITNFGDFMIDNNTNGVNDTLILNLTLSINSSGPYTFIADLEDADGVISSQNNKSLTIGTGKINITVSTKLFSQNKFNYSIRIYNSSNNILVYRKDNLSTNTYLSYEEGINITSFLDKSINNDYLQINLTLDVTDAQTVNVTVVLKYNESSISSTEQKTLTAGTQVVSIKFDNETIKSTHYKGNFTVDSVTIGNKMIDTNKNTSVYDYETFAKTSYIKSYSSGLVDTNANNLSEFLEINFTVNVKTAGSYNLEAELYDEFNNYVALINETETLSTGNQVIQARINGSEIYKTKINGPYSVSFAKLSLGSTITDIVYDAYTTNVTYYTDFERPPLPDLAVTMSVSFSSVSNNTNITVNITNSGEAPAFNVFLDIFDNKTYENNRSVPFMGVDETELYQFNLTNTTEDTLYTVIVDFNNYVDESNESNNIAQNTEEVSNLTISSLINITINNTHMVFLFVINNAGSTTLNNINWTLNPGDGSSIIKSAETFSLASGQTAFIYVEYNYTTESNFIVNATANSGTLTASKNLSINLGNATPSKLDLYDFSMANVSSTHKVFQFMIKNIATNQNLTSISWSLNTGLGTINSIYTHNLTPNNFSFVFVEYNYTQTGDFTLIASANSGSNQDLEIFGIIEFRKVDEKIVLVLKRLV